MNGVLVVNKPSGITSRDVVNQICKMFNTKKVGHTGTLDPLATGVLVVCVGKATKLVDVLTSTDKEYVATVKLGVLTDTLDTEGTIIKRSNDKVNEVLLKQGLNSFVGTYNQEVPLYSAVKIKGKKLYEYARNNETVVPPKRMVEIKSIKLLETSGDEYTFAVTVSKGTYVRSLIKDINERLNVIGVMSSLKRVRQGDFKIEKAVTLEEIANDNYKLLSITEVLKNKDCIQIDDDLYDKVKHGALVKNTYNKNQVTFIHHDKVVAIYKKYDKDNNMLKPLKMFIW